MSAELLLRTLEKLLKLHTSFYKLAVEKTDILKKDDIEALNSHMKEEQKYILAIRQIDEERKKIVDQLLTNAQLQEAERTLRNCIEITAEPEKSSLTDMQQQLTKIVEEVKQRNVLNQQLTHQSLQFVNMTLEMIRPQPQAITYTRPNAKQIENKNARSMFDSKA